MHYHLAGGEGVEVGINNLFPGVVSKLPYLGLIVCSI